MILSLRLRWYVRATARALHRHWQALFLAVLLVLPAMPVFAQSRLLGAPVLAPLSPMHGPGWRFGWVHMLEGIGMLWVLVQRTAIDGGPFATFLKSLPVSSRRYRVLDATVVLVASTPLLLPVIAAVISFAFLPDKASNYLYVVDLTVITLGWQLMALSREIRNGFSLVVANLVLIGALQATGATRTALLAVSLMTAAFALVQAPATSRAYATRSGTSWRRAFERLPVNGAAYLPPFVKLQLGIVRFHFAATVSRCIIMGAVAVFTCYLMGLWGFDTRVLPLTLVAQALISLVAATAYRDLRASRVRAAHFVRSLPLAPTAQVRADVLTVAALALPFAAVAPLLLVAHGVLTAHTAAAVVLAGAPLLALLPLAQRLAPGESVMAGAVFAATWVFVAWQIFV